MQCRRVQFPSTLLHIEPGPWSLLFEGAMVSKDACPLVHTYVNSRSGSWCLCAWNPALRESAPGSGACDWPRLAMVAVAASIEIEAAEQGGWGGGGAWAGSVGQVGQWGVRVEKVPPRGEIFIYGVGGGASVAVEKKSFTSWGNFLFALPLVGLAAHPRNVWVVYIWLRPGPFGGLDCVVWSRPALSTVRLPAI